MTLTYDFDLQSSASCGHDLLTPKRSRSTVSRFRRYSGNARTDRRTDGGDRITYLANSVGINRNQREESSANAYEAKLRRLRLISCTFNGDIRKDIAVTIVSELCVGQLSRRAVVGV